MGCRCVLTNVASIHDLGIQGVNGDKKSPNQNSERTDSSTDSPAQRRNLWPGGGWEEVGEDSFWRRWWLTQPSKVWEDSSRWECGTWVGVGVGRARGNILSKGMGWKSMHGWNWIDESEEGGEVMRLTCTQGWEEQRPKCWEWEAAGCCGQWRRRVGVGADGPAPGHPAGPERKGTWRSHWLLCSLVAQDFIFWDLEDLFKILSRMEWFGILENLRKNKYAAEL